MQREKDLDIAKGIGIVLSIFGHINYSFLHNFIYMFHMPLFFFLSGYFFDINKYNFRDFAKKKFKTLIIPYFLIGIILLIFNYFIHGDFTLYKFFIQKRSQTIWFLTSLFFSELVFYVICKIFKNYTYIGIIVTMLFIFGNVLSNIFSDISLPWNVDSILFSLFFLWGGLVYKKNQHLICRYQKYLFITFIIFLPILYYLTIKVFHSPVDFFYNHYGFFPINLLSAVMGIYCILFFSNYIVKVKFLSHFFSFLGINSLIFFSFQSIPIRIIHYYVDLNQYGLCVSAPIYFILTILELNVVLFVLYLFNNLLKFTHLRKYFYGLF